MKSFLIFLLSFVVMYCSPERRIILQNNSNSYAHIIFKLKEDSAKTNPLFISNSTEVKFDLKNAKPYNYVRMSYGIGKWSMNEINNLANDLEFIEIQSEKENIKVATLNEIMKYLAQHRKGITKTKILIVL